MRTDSEKTAMRGRQRAEEETFQRINALFGAYREAEGEELSALTREKIPYVVFLNGMLHSEGVRTNPPSLLPERAIKATLEAVAQRWPDHAWRTVVWRSRPQYEDQWWPDPEEEDAYFQAIVSKEEPEPREMRHVMRVRLAGV